MHDVVRPWSPGIPEGEETLPERLAWDVPPDPDPPDPLDLVRALFAGKLANLPGS